MKFLDIMDNDTNLAFRLRYENFFNLNKMVFDIVIHRLSEERAKDSNAVPYDGLILTIGGKIYPFMYDAFNGLQELKVQNGDIILSDDVMGTFKCSKKLVSSITNHNKLLLKLVLDPVINSDKRLTIDNYIVGYHRFK